MNEPIKPNEPFFILGHGRSGTTMLRLMLNEHPRLRVPYESKFIVELLDNLSLNSPLSKKDKQLAFNLISKHKGWSGFYLISNNICNASRQKEWEETNKWNEAKEILWKEFQTVANRRLWDAISSLEKPLLGELIDAVFRNCIDLENKSRWGDKTPQYTIEVDRLHKIFPHSKFIHIIRDVRDVYRSNFYKDRTILGKEKRIKRWSEIVTKCMEFGEKIGQDLYLEIKYEDLVLETEKILKRICNFLEEEYDSKMLNFSKNSLKNNVNLSHHRKTFRPPQPSDTYRWRTEISLIEVSFVEIFARETLEKIGYNSHFRGRRIFVYYFVKTSLPIVKYTLIIQRKILRIPSKIAKIFRAEN